MIPGYVPLSRADERVLILAAKAGDVKSRNELILLHRPLVLGRVRRFLGPAGGGSLFDDLAQEGMLGLFAALGKFNPKIRIRFFLYATFWVDAYIKAGYGKTVYGARDRKTEYVNSEVLEQVPSDQPTSDLRFADCEFTTQLHAALARVRKAMGPLGWDILESRLMDDVETLQDVSKRHQCSRESVRQAEKRVRALLARYLEPFRDAA